MGNRVRYGRVGKTWKVKRDDRGLGSLGVAKFINTRRDDDIVFIENVSQRIAAMYTLLASFS